MHQMYKYQYASVVLILKTIYMNGDKDTKVQEWEKRGKHTLESCEPQDDHLFPNAHAHPLQSDRRGGRNAINARQEIQSGEIIVPSDILRIT